MKNYNRALPGPAINTAFRVLTGVAVVTTTEFAFPIPAGGTWPGDQLSPDLVDALQPSSVELLPDTTTTPQVTPADLQAGVALARTVALMKGPLKRRLALLPAEWSETSNLTTLAGAVSASREHLSKLRHQERAQ